LTLTHLRAMIDTFPLSQEVFWLDYFGKTSVVLSQSPKRIRKPKQFTAPVLTRSAPRHSYWRRTQNKCNEFVSKISPLLCPDPPPSHHLFQIRCSYFDQEISGSCLVLLASDKWWHRSRALRFRESGGDAREELPRIPRQKIIWNKDWQGILLDDFWGVCN
jgi:hypothetical protein